MECKHCHSTQTERIKLPKAGYYREIVHKPSCKLFEVKENGFNQYI